MQRMKLDFKQLGWGRLARLASFAALAIGLGRSPELAIAGQPGQRTFSSAENASRAFFEAALRDDEGALLEILGPTGKEIIISGDPIEDESNRMRFVVKYKEIHRLAKEPNGTTNLYVGAENWLMPIPLVDKGGAWLAGRCSNVALQPGPPG
jgi:hypothetical protein